MRTLGLILLAALTASPLAAQMPNLVEVMPRHYYAITGCDRQGEVGTLGWLDGPDSLLILVRAHEAKHREQSARFASCKAWMDAIGHNAYLAAEGEVEAWAATLKKARQMTMDTEAMRGDFISRVYRLFLGQVPLTAIMGWFDKYDPPLP